MKVDAGQRWCISGDGTRGRRPIYHGYRVCICFHCLHGRSGGAVVENRNLAYDPVRLRYPLVLAYVNRRRARATPYLPVPKIGGEVAGAHLRSNGLAVDRAGVPCS